MAVFDRTPIEGIINNLKYFWDCSIWKKSREERFIELFKKRENDKIENCKVQKGYCNIQDGHCQYWFTTEEMQNEYNKLCKKHLDIHDVQLEFGRSIYDKFEKDYCIRYHEEWCIYEIHGEKLRSRIRTIGRTLHALCHAPIELIQFRMLGLNLWHEKIFEQLETAKQQKNINKEKELHDKSIYILHKEQFTQHYFELLSLRNTISEEIKLQEKQSSTLIGWMYFFGSTYIALWLSSLTTDIKNLFQNVNFPIGPIIIPLNIFYILFAVILFLLLSSIIWYIWVSIKLNEAKDVMYICLGVDVDNPKSLTCQ